MTTLDVWTADLPPCDGDLATAKLAPLLGQSTTPAQDTAWAGGPLIGRSRAIQRLGPPQRTELRRRPEIVSISTVRPVWIECTMASSTPRYIMMCPG